MKVNPQEKIAKKIGMNRTGQDTSPLLSKAMMNETEELTLPRCPPGNGEAIAENRILYMRESDGVGSTPVPASLKGMLKTGMKMLEGHDPKGLIDKLGERLAFERTGVRIYEALISKFLVDEEGFSKVASLERLQEIRDEELLHFRILNDVIESLGADPTAITPSADIIAVASLGIVKVVSDPNIDFFQSLDAILVAELADTDCWNLLIELTSEAGLKDIASQFEECFNHEKEHLQTLRTWVRQVGLGSGPTIEKHVA